MTMNRTTYPVACLLLAVGLLMQACRTAEPVQGEVPELNNFRVDVDFMHPRRWSSRSVWDYWVTIANDSVECHLPYMGVKYQADFYDEGLDFRLPLTSFRRGRGRKGQAEMELTFRRNMTGYRLTITLYPGGKANLYLLPTNGDGIGYDGEWKAL